MTYRWLSIAEIEHLVNPVMRVRGWAELNLEGTCRVMGAFGPDGHLVEFFAVQLFPMMGPLVRIDNTKTDAGDTTRNLVSAVDVYLTAKECRGFLVIAENPFTQRLCERRKMQRVGSPVYLSKPEV